MRRRAVVEPEGIPGVSAGDAGTGYGNGGDIRQMTETASPGTRRATINRRRPNTVVVRCLLQYYNRAQERTAIDTFREKRQRADPQKWTKRRTARIPVRGGGGWGARGEGMRKDKVFSALTRCRSMRGDGTGTRQSGISERVAQEKDGKKQGDGCPRDGKECSVACGNKTMEGRNNAQS